MNKREKEKIINKWKEKNGGAEFDIKNRDIIFWDCGLFSIIKVIKKRSRHRFIKIKKGKLKGCSEMIDIKGPKVKYEDYYATFWFEELDETINYLKRMKKMLNKLGYKTNTSIENEKRFNEEIRKMTDL